MRHWDAKNIPRPVMLKSEQEQAQNENQNQKEEFHAAQEEYEADRAAKEEEISRHESHG